MKQNKRITSRVLWNMRAHVFLHARARACYTCEHVLPTRASTCFLHVRAHYLFVRARLLFKNVRPGQLKNVSNTCSLFQLHDSLGTFLWMRSWIFRSAFWFLWQFQLLNNLWIALLCSECKIPGKSNILAFPQVGWGFELRRALVGWGGVGAFLTFTSSFKFTSS